MCRGEKIVVTGCSGYIGAALSKELSRRGALVFGIDRNPPLEELGLKQFLMVDISQAENVPTIKEMLRGAKTLFHLAAARTDWGLDYDGYFRDNAQVTSNLIEAAKGAEIREWVYFSTVGVYGPSAIGIDESAPLNPSSDYAVTKTLAENTLLDVAKVEDWSVRCLRPSAVFSEYQPTNTNIYRLIEAIRRNRFALIGDGGEIKTTSYLNNTVAAALWLYRDLEESGIKIFNYVDEPRLTTRQMIDAVRKQLGMKIPLLRFPLGLVEPPARALDWIGNSIGRDFPVTAARIRKFCTATNFSAQKIHEAGFKPPYSSDEALRRTVLWHQTISRGGGW